MSIVSIYKDHNCKGSIVPTALHGRNLSTESLAGKVPCIYSCCCLDD